MRTSIKKIIKTYYIPSYSSQIWRDLKVGFCGKEMKHELHYFAFY
jgi:hypothetical protein